MENLTDDEIQFLENSPEIALIKEIFGIEKMQIEFRKLTKQEREDFIPKDDPPVTSDVTPPQSDAQPIQQTKPTYKRATIDRIIPPPIDEIIGQPKDQKLRYDINTRLRFRAIFDADYSKRQFIKPGFPVGIVAGMTAPGGSSKTFKALQDSVLLSATEEYGPPIGVLYLPAEDGLDEIGIRLQAIVKTYGMTDDEINLADQNLQVWNLLGEAPDLLEKKGDTRPLVDAICEIAKTYHRDPLRLVIFDTLRRFSYADENSSGDMSKVLSAMELICKRCNCSCMFLHHTTKSAALANQVDVQQASRGSSVLVDNIRYQEYLRIMTAEEANQKGEIIDGKLPTKAIGEDNRKYYICWGVSKQNYGELVKDQWYKRNEYGVLVRVELAKVKENAGNKGRRSNEL